jgi:tight adherence protein C
MDSSILIPIGFVFLSVGAAIAAALWLLTDPQVAQRRLARVAVGSSAVAQESLLVNTAPQSVTRVQQYLPKSPKDMRRLEKLLASAGYHGAWSAILFSIGQLLLAVVLGGGALWYLGPGKLLYVLAAGAVGYMAPNLWLGRAIEGRKTLIRNGLADAIDLLIVCIESGSGIDQAVNRVAEELALPYPDLARELEMIGAEMRAGKPRIEAFKNFAERTKVDDVRSLVAMLIQTDRFGTSVGQALRTHAETSRTKRRQRAEEKAAKLGVKLLFPLVFCLFPAFYVVVLGPSAIRIWREIVWGGLGMGM